MRSYKQLSDDFEQFLATDYDWQGSSRTIANKFREFLKIKPLTNLKG